MPPQIPLPSFSDGKPPSGINAKRDGRQRKEVKFWFDLSKPEQNELASWLFSLKSARQFAPTIRAALTIWRELLMGQLDTLLTYFPFVSEALAVPQDDYTAHLEHELADTRARLDYLEQLVSARVNAPASSTFAPIPAYEPVYEPVLVGFDDLPAAAVSEPTDEQLDAAFDDLLNMGIDLF